MLQAVHAVCKPGDEPPKGKKWLDLCRSQQTMHLFISLQDDTCYRNGSDVVLFYEPSLFTMAGCSNTVALDRTYDILLIRHKHA